MWMWRRLTSWWRRRSSSSATDDRRFALELAMALGYPSPTRLLMDLSDAEWAAWKRHLAESRRR